MQDFQYAVKEKMTPDHDVIDDAIRERAEGYTVFSIPVGVLYRPNEAKVKNLKTKDYLGKARLIATATSNTSTGFAGAEAQERRIFESSAKDDRPPEKISYAATNLVHRNLTSRGGREQSAPPAMGRNFFPPTPPPEGDKRLSGGVTPMRNQSLRNSGSRTAAQIDGRQQVLSIRTQSYEVTPPASTDSKGSLYDEKQRPGATRTASEPRGPQARQKLLERSTSQNTRSSAPLYRETTQQQLGLMPEDDTIDDLYNAYDKRSSRRGKKHTSQQQDYIDEEDEYINSSPDELASQHNTRSSSRGASVTSETRRTSKRPDMTKIRVKVHANEDTRYIMINSPYIDYDDFESRIREKFGLRGKMKMLMRDFDDEPGQMITMADQDDLDVLLSHVKQVARKERNQLGKMEVYIQQMS